jgi:GWxTD domain-containing protein
MRSKVLLALSCLAAVLAPLAAQQQRETVARPMSERQKRRAEQRLKKELETPYKKWLDEEVRWIISDEERTAFSRLQTDDERQEFIEQFWLRRDPSPDTEENEFREEHYRRIAWANDRFASGIPGWKTDRGQIYIKFGPPDENDSHPSPGPGVRDIEEGGGNTTFFAYERWRYRYIEGVGQDVILEFVDKSMTNEYRLTWDPSEKDALLRVPGAGLTLYEQMGLADKADRFTNQTGMQLGAGPLSNTSRMNVFDRYARYVAVQKAPPIKFKDLDAVVNSTIKYNLLPMQVRVDYIPVTESSVNTNITIQFNRSDLQFKQNGGVAEAVVNIYGRITSMTRRQIGPPFEEVVKATGPAELMGQLVQGASIYQKTLPLAPGRYRLTIVCKDVVGENMTTYDVALDVPRLQEDVLSASSLILADQLEKLPTRSIGTGMFAIGSNKVRPKLDETFKRTDTLGIYMQIYNFDMDEATRKPEGTITYEIVRNGSNEKVLDFTEEVSAIEGAAAAQTVIAKRLPLANLEPGEYTLQLKVVDKIGGETLTPSAKFKVI